MVTGKEGRQLKRKQIEECSDSLVGNGRMVGCTGQGTWGLPTYHLVKISSLDIDGGRKYSLGLRT